MILFPLPNRHSTILVVALVRVTAMVVAKRHFMSVGIVAVKFVASGVDTPICMAFFPVMKARQTIRIQSQPDLVWA